MGDEIPSVTSSIDPIDHSEVPAQPESLAPLNGLGLWAWARCPQVNCNCVWVTQTHGDWDSACWHPRRWSQQFVFCFS